MSWPDPLIETAIGDTPLVALSRIVPAGSADVWLKLESGNPTGSYKDRMAVSVIGRAIERGDVRPGDRVVEYTGGSTGMALAFVCARVGLRFTAVTGVGGSHRVEGIGVGFEPPFLDRDRCRQIRTIDEGAAMTMARRLAAEEGLLVGTSTGLNVCAAIELARELGPGRSVVTLGCDSGTKYLSGELFA